MVIKSILLAMSLIAVVSLVIWSLKYDDNDDFNGWG